MAQALPLLLSNPQFAQAAPQVVTAVAPQAGKTARTLFIVLGIIIAIVIILIFVALISKKKKKGHSKGKGTK